MGWTDDSMDWKESMYTVSLSDAPRRDWELDVTIMHAVIHSNNVCILKEMMVIVEYEPCKYCQIPSQFIQLVFPNLIRVVIVSKPVPVAWRPL